MNPSSRRSWLGCVAALAGLSANLGAQEPPAAFGTLLRASPAGMTAEMPSIGPARPQPATQPPSGDKGVDLSGQFPTGSRNQADVGSCHVFASIGLLEAAYYRKTGERVQFSEADLFLRNTVLNGSIYSGNIFDRGYTWGGKPEFKEGGSPGTLLSIGDIDFAIRNGVATAPQYDAFVQRYRQYRDAEQRTLADIERQRQRDPWYVRLLYNPRTHWARMQRDPVNQRILQNYLIGNDATIEAQRAETRQKLQGMRVSQTLFIALPSSFDREKDACRQDGRGRTSAVLSELQAGRPVAVSYFTDNNWGSHVLIISGYRVDDTGGVVFKTRNSWGPGGDFDMFPHDMCKVHGVLSVRESGR